MHERSQVQDQVWQDVANTRNLRERFRDLVVCKYEPPSIEAFYLHRRSCNACREYAIEIGDFVKCPYCKYASSNIVSHLKKEHSLDDEKIKQDKLETCSKNYKARNGKAVSNAILNSAKERQRRSKLLGELNKTSVFRNKASETAVKTSARKDIQQQRAEQLRQWRSENPEEFKDKCWSKMLEADKKWKKTKPEKFMIEWLKGKYGSRFEWGKMLRSKLFLESGKSDRKQIDFRSNDRNIFIEIDGPFHFTNLTRKEQIKSQVINEAIERAKERDKILEKIITDKQKTLIRVGYGTWCVSTGRVEQKVLDKISHIVDANLQGIYKIGDVYGENNCL